MLVEKDMILTDEKQVANIMNEHFVRITKKVSLKTSISSKRLWFRFFFHDHISIKKIKEIYPEIVTNSFKFEPVTKDNIENEMQWKWKTQCKKKLSNIVGFLLKS